MRRPLVFVSLSVILIFCLLHLLGFPPVPDPPDTKRADLYLASPHIVTFRGTVRRCETRDMYTVLILTKVQLHPSEYSVSASESFHLSDIRITLNEETHYRAGTQITLRGVVKPVRGASNPGEFDQTLYYRTQGIGYLSKNPAILSASTSFSHFHEALAVLRNRADAEILRIFPEDTGGILCAMLTGTRSYLSDDSRSLWQSGGISHMLAISGLHLSVLGMGLFHLLRGARLGNGPAGLLSAALLFLYALFTGLSVSSLRAFLMFSLFLGAKAAGRTYDSLTALSVSALFILLGNPWYLLWSGFQFSFAAALICALSSGRSRFVVTGRLYLGLLPLVLRTYFSMPLYSLPVNLLAVPLLSVILISGILGLLFGAVTQLSAFSFSASLTASGIFSLSSLLTLISAPAVLLIRLINLLVSLIAYLPLSQLVTGCPGTPQTLLYYGLLTLFFRKMKTLRNRRRKYLCLLLVPLLVCVLCWRVPDRTLRIDFLDVGQGDGACIRTPDGSCILVDGGSSSRSGVGSHVLMPYLMREGITRIDLMLLTHGDTDHISGAVEILDAISTRTTPLRVSMLVLPALSDRASLTEVTSRAEVLGIPVLFVQTGDTFTIGDVILRVLNPIPALEETPPDENASCIVFALRLHRFDALFTGDVTGKAEDAVTEALASRPGCFEVLKVSHHGSSYSTSESFLAAVRPQLGVISVSADNRYGHPGYDLLARMEKGGTDILRTDLDGAVSIRTDGASFTCRTFFDDPKEEKRYLCG